MFPFPLQKINRIYNDWDVFPVSYMIQLVWWHVKSFIKSLQFKLIGMAVIIASRSRPPLETRMDMFLPYVPNLA